MFKKHKGKTVEIVKSHQREKLGLRIHSKPSSTGCAIIGIVPGSPSDRAGGLAEGNKITAVNGRSVIGCSHAQVIAALQSAGSHTKITVATDGQKAKQLPSPMRAKLVKQHAVHSPTKNVSPPKDSRTPKDFRTQKDPRPPMGLVDRLYNSFAPSRSPDFSTRYSPTKAENLSQAADQMFAALLQVPLPAEFECIGLSRKDGNPLPCAVHLEPRITAEKITLLHPGEYVNVVAMEYDWMLVDGTNSGSYVHGWVCVGSGANRCLRPVPPKEFPWQRARGMGVYSDVLTHRKIELRNQDLADDPELLREWTALIAELDVALRLKSECDARGHKIVPTNGERPRSQSFMANRRRNGIQTASKGTKISSLRKPRSSSFATLPLSKTKRIRSPLEDDYGSDEDEIEEGRAPMHHSEIRERWRMIKEEQRKATFNLRDRSNIKSSIKEPGRRRGGLRLGREAISRAKEVVVVKSSATKKESSQENSNAGQVWRNSSIGNTGTSPSAYRYGGVHFPSGGLFVSKKQGEEEAEVQKSHEEAQVNGVDNIEENDEPEIYAEIPVQLEDEPVKSEFEALKRQIEQEEHEEVVKLKLNLEQINNRAALLNGATFEPVQFEPVSLDSPILDPASSPSDHADEGDDGDVGNVHFL